MYNQRQATSGQQGFSLVELIVVIFIMGLLLTVVLTNYRVGQYSSELDIALKQTVSGIEYVRTMTLGGQITDDLDSETADSFPDNGYGVHFDLLDFSQYNSFAAFESANVPLRTAKLHNVKVVYLCGSVDIGNSLPCDESSEEELNWVDISNSVDIPGFLEIIFSSPDEIIYEPDDGEDFKYVGGVIEHTKTGNQAYFYISLVTGLIASGTL